MNSWKTQILESPQNSKTRWILQKLKILESPRIAESPKTRWIRTQILESQKLKILESPQIFESPKNVESPNR